MSLWSPFRAYRTAHPDNYHMWLCFLGWLMLFAVGVSAPSEPFRTILVSIITQTKTAAGFDVKPTAAPAPASPANPTTPNIPTTPANPARDGQAIAGPAPAGPDTAALTRTAAFNLASDSPIPEPRMSPRLPDAENTASESAGPGPAQPAAGTSPTPGWSWPVRIAAVAPLVLAVFVTFTPTNLLLLCCFSAALGSYAVRLIPQAFDAGTPAASSKSRPTEPPPEPPGVPAVIAMLHGLIVFAAAVAGLIVVQGEFQWDQTRGDLYLRLAATVTIVSIAAGTNRHFVRDLAQAFMPFRAGQNLSSSSRPAPGGPGGAGPGPEPGGGGTGGGDGPD